MSKIIKKTQKFIYLNHKVRCLPECVQTGIMCIGAYWLALPQVCEHDRKPRKHRPARAFLLTAQRISIGLKRNLYLQLQCTSGLGSLCTSYMHKLFQGIAGRKCLFKVFSHALALSSFLISILKMGIEIPAHNKICRRHFVNNRCL